MQELIQYTPVRQVLCLQPSLGWGSGMRLLAAYMHCTAPGSRWMSRCFTLEQPCTPILPYPMLAGRPVNCILSYEWSDRDWQHRRNSSWPEVDMPILDQIPLDSFLVSLRLSKRHSFARS